jgi:hypothetical protein
MTLVFFAGYVCLLTLTRRGCLAEQREGDDTRASATERMIGTTLSSALINNEGHVETSHAWIKMWHHDAVRFLGS